MEPKSESANISIDSDDEAEAEPDKNAENKYNITVLGVADSLLLDSPNCLENKVNNITRLVD